MKKLYYAASLLTMVSLSVLTGCKKDTVAFPTNPQSNGTYPDLAYTTPWFPTIANADGIFISAQVTDEKTVIISPSANMYEYGMAKIAASTGNFSSLVDGGTITLNDSILAKSTALSYLSSITNYTLGLSNRISWSIAGNGSSVSAITHTWSAANNPTYNYDPATWDPKWVPILPRVLVPVPAYPLNPLTHQDSLNYPTALTYTASASSYTAAVALHKADSTTHHIDSTYNATVQYSIPIKTSNADSVFIYMTDNVNGLVYKRTCLPTDTIASFKPNDFPLSTQYDIPSFKLQINAINYQDTIHSGSKVYYFLKMASAIKYYQATK